MDVNNFDHPVAMATWGSEGNGYLNQEGHRFIWIGISENPEYPHLFESVANVGYVVDGISNGAGRITTNPRNTATTL